MLQRDPNEITVSENRNDETTEIMEHNCPDLIMLDQVAWMAWVLLESEISVLEKCVY